MSKICYFTINMINNICSCFTFYLHNTHAYCIVVTVIPSIFIVTVIPSIFPIAVVVTDGIQGTGNSSYQGPDQWVLLCVNILKHAPCWGLGVWVMSEQCSSLITVVPTVYIGCTMYIGSSNNNNNILLFGKDAPGVANKTHNTLNCILILVLPGISWGRVS